MTITEVVLQHEEESHRLIDQKSYVQRYKRIKEEWGRKIAKVGYFERFKF